MCGARTEKFMDLCTLLERREFVNIILGISGYSPDPIRELTRGQEEIYIFLCLVQSFSPSLSFFFLIIINMGIRVNLRVPRSLLYVQESFTNLSPYKMVG
jgi:hypothetical protein